MAFPYGTSAAIFAFDLIPTGGSSKLGNLTLERLRDLVHDRMYDEQVPPDEVLTSTDDYHWGWMYLDGENPISVDRWCAWGIRAFVKKPPKKLVKAMQEARIEELKGEGTKKLSRDERQEIYDSIRAEQVAKMPPNIEEHPILFDTLNNRVYLFVSSKTQREAMQERLRRVLEPMLGEYEYRPWNLEHFLRLTRPQATLPADVGERFLTWLAIHAHHERWMATVADGKTVRVQVALEDRLNVIRESGAAKLDGDEIVQQYVESIEVENGMRVTGIRLHMISKVGDEATRTHQIMVDSDGLVASVKIIDATKLSKKDDAEVAILDRADEYQRALWLLRMLMHGFNITALAETLKKEAQTQLWPGAPTGAIHWNDAGTVDWQDDPDENSEAQGDLFGSVGDTIGDEDQANMKDRIAALNQKADSQAIEAAKQMGYEHGSAGVNENPWPLDRAEHNAYEDGFQTAMIHKQKDQSKAQQAAKERTDRCQGVKANGEPCTAKAFRDTGFCNVHQSQGAQGVGA